MRLPFSNFRNTAFFLLALFLSGCSGETMPTTQLISQTATKPPTMTASSPLFTATPNNQPIVSPYLDVLIESVEIRIVDANLSRVELVIRGSLPDQCKYGFYTVENRGDHNIKITLKGIHPQNTTCAQTAQSIEYIYQLGRDMPESKRGLEAGNYELTVNNYSTSFTIEE
jgi:hypothetical protein